jgi:hypothetical protein
MGRWRSAWSTGSSSSLFTSSGTPSEHRADQGSSGVSRKADFWPRWCGAASGYMVDMAIRGDARDEMRGEVGDSLLLFALAAVVMIVGVLLGSAF